MTLASTMPMQSPVRAAVHQKITWMGGDRQIISMALGVLVILAYVVWVAFGMLYGLTVIVPVVLMGVVVIVARKLFAADPYMLDVWLQQMQYAAYYTPFMRVKNK